MNNSCSICLSDNIDINNLCMINDCNHSFCISCLTNWLESGNFTCPLCRIRVTEYKKNDIHYRIILYNTNNTNNTNNDDDDDDNNINIRTLNRNLFYQNLRLKSCTVILFIISFMISYLYILTDWYYKSLLNTCNNYYNCTIEHCDNKTLMIC